MEPINEESLEQLSPWEIDRAIKACIHWRTALVVSWLCTPLGLIWQIIACRHLQGVKRTLLAPGVIGGLILVWPVLTAVMLLFRLASWTGLHLTQVVYGLFATQIVASFFVRQSIFRQWTRWFSDATLEWHIKWWERAILFGQFPLAAMVIWVSTMVLLEGMAFHLFDFLNLGRAEWIGMGILGLTLFVLWLASIVLEFRIMGLFQNRLWARVRFRMVQKLKAEKEAMREALRQESGAQPL